MQNHDNGLIYDMIKLICSGDFSLTSVSNDNYNQLVYFDSLLTCETDPLSDKNTINKIFSPLENLIWREFKMALTVFYFAIFGKGISSALSTFGL